LALSWLAGCSDSSKPEATNSDLRGQIVDAFGLPVAGAGVVLEYASDPPAGSAYDKPRTGISFELPSAGAVTLWISSFCDGDTVSLLADGELPSGQHTIIWNGRDSAGRTLPDGVYRYNLVTATGEDHQPFVLFHLGYRNLPEGAVLAPLVVTDARGRFALSQECLPLGFTFDGFDERETPIAACTITRTVRVWVCAGESGALACYPAVTVDPDSGVEVRLTVGH
jgi:hypothetical protein